MKTVKDFQLVDHGIEHSQYFQGCGCSFTEYDHCVTGIGVDPTEAIEECLENIACDDIDTDDLYKRILEENMWDKLPTSPCVEEEDDEMYYHVSIRYTVEGE